MKKLGLIVFIAMFALVACTKSTPSPVILPDVTIIGSTDVVPEKTGVFTATLSEEAQGNVTIKVVNANPTVLTLAAEDIIIAKGATSGTINFTGKSSGLAKISFTSADATVKTPELTVIIPIVDFWMEYPEFDNGTLSAISKIVIGNQTLKSSATNSPDGPNKQLAGNDDFSIGAVSDDNTGLPIPLTDGIAYTIYYDNFTADDGVEMAVALYIDWNGDGDFADASEEIMIEKGIPANAKKEISGIISIPAVYALSDLEIYFRGRVMCYSVEDNVIKSGGGYATSGYLMDFMCTK